MRPGTSLVLCALALAGCPAPGGGGGGGDATLITFDAAATDEGPAPDMNEGGSDTGPDEDARPTEDGGIDPDGGGGAGCVGGGTYGVVQGPTSVASGHSVRAVWTGNEWGALWQAPHEEAGLNRMLFQRFNAAGEGIGEPTEVGFARLPQHTVLYTGSGYVVVWMSAREGAAGSEGITIQVLGQAGNPVGVPALVPQTFDVTQLEAAWAALGSGMIVFSRGRTGDGLWVVRVDEGGQPATPVHVYDRGPADNPSVVYGDGTWGVAWIDPGVMPSDLAFTVINDAGVFQAQVQRIMAAGARGRTHLAYGQLLYGVGWSRNDELGGLRAQLSLFDSLAIEQATHDVAGPEGFALVTDVGWLDPDTFGVAWQDNNAGDVSVGMTRIGHLGQMFEPAGIGPEGDASLQNLQLSGNVTRGGGWYTEDPAPPIAGGFSDEVTVNLAIFGPCD